MPTTQPLNATANSLHEKPFATSSSEWQHDRAADLELAFAAALVGVALIESLAARTAHFKQEPALLPIEKIDLLDPFRTKGSLHKRLR